MKKLQIFLLLGLAAAQLCLMTTVYPVGCDISVVFKNNIPAQVRDKQGIFWTVQQGDHDHKVITRLEDGILVSPTPEQMQVLSQAITRCVVKLNNFQKGHLARGLTVSFKDNVPTTVLDANSKLWVIREQDDGRKVIARVVGSTVVYPTLEERSVILASISRAAEKNCSEKGHPIIVGFSLAK